MGGDGVFYPTSSSEDELLVGQDFSRESIKSDFLSGNEEGLSSKLENGSVINGKSGQDSAECPSFRPRRSSILKAGKKQRQKVYAEVLRSYKELDSRIAGLQEAKNKVLSYTPGSWFEKAGGMDLSEYEVPKTTSVLLIGPRGSGKSSLINKISRALEDGSFSSGRAQVSYNSSMGDGTYFLHGYMIPRGSDSFCLYDTRSLSDNLSENMGMLEQWMKKGVRHGELVERKSDSTELRAQLKCKARQNFSCRQVREVNYVIFVLNGLSVLESMTGDAEKKKQFSRLMASTFNCPLLSFRDDKPVVVVTHGDLIPIADRVKIRIHLGELLGVSPMSQIFDIPDDNNPATTVTVLDMLTYCLERADSNLPTKNLHLVKVPISLPSMAFLMVLVIAIIFQGLRSQVHQPYTGDPDIDVDWHEIRHLWSGSD